MDRATDPSRRKMKFQSRDAAVVASENGRPRRSLYRRLEDDPARTAATTAEAAPRPASGVASM